MTEEVTNKDIRETSLESKKTDRRNSFLWYSYDLADTFFSQTVISLAFTPFAMLLGVLKGWTYIDTFVIVSIVMAGSNLLVAILSPIIGAISDTLGKRKPILIIVAAIMVASTILIAVWENFWWACGFFVIANFMYQNGRMLYDSQIPFIAQTEDRSTTQAIGGAIAAFGSIFGVLVGLVLNGLGPADKWTPVNTNIWELANEEIPAVNLGNLRYVFLVAGIMIILFSLPYLFHKEVENPSGLKPKENLKKSMSSLWGSLKLILKDRNSLLFFIGWFFLVDAANTTILFMVPVIEGAVGVDNSTTTYIIILSGILLSIVFGFITGRVLKNKGPKVTFLISGIAWMAAIILTMLAGLQYKTELVWNGWSYNTIIYFIPWWIMFFGAIGIGVGFGSIWIVGRQFIMVLAPPSKLAQYNGFQKIAGRVSAIASPLIFSGMMLLGFKLAISANHSFRIALASILLFFIIGEILVAFIKDPYKRYDKGERAPYIGLYDKKKSEE
ncbi:MAG: MFS transporter [Candidatus Heimdallarchaeota archaeon]|nr:MFS transporter [Candidatus Heimdallarchaeota archaeon]MBY8993068.1 MFS transporter [Candidatus Heimdallarchaeota archaeon]